MTTVVISDVAKTGLKDGLDEIFAPFGGVGQVLPDAGTVYVKPNGVHFSPGTHTSPEVLDAVLAYLRDHGYRKLAVMENCTHGNFTRLVFHLTGYKRICKKHGARPVYLDEGPTVSVTRPDEEAPIEIPRMLHEELVANRGANSYLAVPRLKTHSMTVVTLGIKGQQAFPIDRHRMHEHNDRLHARLARLLALIRPDFTLIDGLVATIHGHFPATRLLKESTAPLNVLIGGADAVAVDAVGAKALGYDLEEVEHLRLAHEWGLGNGDLSTVRVVGPLGRFQTRYPHRLLRAFPPDVRIVSGKTRACVEGCKGNPECVLEMLYNDFRGQGGFTLIYGEGIDSSELEDLPGDILVVGPCAVAETKDILSQAYPDRRVYFVDEHNDLMSVTTYMARIMGVPPLRMVPANPLLSVLLLAQAKLRGLNSRVPPILG